MGGDLGSVRLGLLEDLMRWLLLAGALLAAPAVAGPFGPRPPKACEQYRGLFAEEFRRAGLRQVYRPWLAGQIEQESSCRADARSAYAIGLTQFTPAAEETANRRWSTELAGLGGARNPRWAVRAQMLDMKLWIVRFAERGSPTARDRFGLAARGYNGGVGWILDERRAATGDGGNPHLYDTLPPYCERFRSAENCAENLSYWPHIERRARKYRRWF